MAGYKFHIIFGLIFAAAIAFVSGKYNIFGFTTLELISAIPILFVYSILPDIDISSSKISNIFRTISLVIIIISVLFGLKILAISIASILLILQFVGHRKFIHTITAGLLFSLLILD